MSYQPLTIAQGADGYLAFFTGTNGIAGDNDLFWDRANNRLGIGNESPNCILDVSTDAVTPPLRLSRHHDTASYATKIQFLRSRGTRDAATQLYTGDALVDLDFYGMDQNAPAYQLAAKYASTVESISGTRVSGNHIWSTNNTSASFGERMRLDADGNLGVGTDDPSNLLHIRKDQNALTELLVQNATAGTGASARVHTQSNSNELHMCSYSSTAGGTIGGISGSDLAALFSTDATNFVLGTYTSAPLSFITTNIVAMTIDTSQYVKVENRLGVGVSPSYIIDTLESNAGLSLARIKNSNTGVSARAGVQVAADVAACNIMTYSSNSTMTYDGITLDNATRIAANELWLTPAGDLYFGTNNAISMFIESDSGSVGIGTVSPHEALTINGVISLKEQASCNRIHDGYGSIWAKTDGTLHYTNDSGKDGYVTTSETNTEDGYLAFFTGPGNIAGDNDLHWDRENNRLGIGTSSPQTELHIKGKGFGTAQFRLQAATPDGDTWITAYDETDTRMWIMNFGDRSNSNCWSLYSHSAAAYVFNVAADGDVGIQRYNTTYTFEVNGTAGKTAGGTAWADMSDINEKKDMSDIIGQDGYDQDGYTALERLTLLKGIMFRWIDPSKHGNEDGYERGFIAQEVEKIFPDWVFEDSEGAKWLQMVGLEAYFVEALKEIKQEVEENKNNIADHEARLAALEGA